MFLEGVYLMSLGVCVLMSLGVHVLEGVYLMSHGVCVFRGYLISLGVCVFRGVYLMSLGVCVFRGCLSGVCLFRECLSNVPGCLCFVSMNYLIVLEASIWGWGGNYFSQADNYTQAAGE